MYSMTCRLYLLYKEKHAEKGLARRSNVQCVQNVQYDLYLLQRKKGLAQEDALAHDAAVLHCNTKTWLLMSASLQGLTRKLVKPFSWLYGTEAVCMGLSNSFLLECLTSHQQHMMFLPHNIDVFYHILFYPYTEITLSRCGHIILLKILLSQSWTQLGFWFCFQKSLSILIPYLPV